MRKIKLRFIFAFSFILLFSYAFRESNVGTPYVFPELYFFPKMPVSAANPVTKEGAELGRFLFYDPVLSSDSTISCSSCHKQQFAFSDAPNAFSKGLNGDEMERNTPPLFNLAWYPALFWDGKAASIEEQVFHPVRAHTEMNMRWTQVEKRIRANKFYVRKFRAVFGDQKIDSTLISKAIAQFERTLISYRSKYDKVLIGKAEFTKDEIDGLVLLNDMTGGDCLHCHTTDANSLGTTLDFKNNGLDTVMFAASYKDKGRGKITGSIRDYGKFKVPSLRNVALTAPYMHDGRFKTQEEVIDFYSEGVNACVNIDARMGSAKNKGVHLTAEEKQKIVSFLKTLSDSAFISDPAFSNPFVKK